jgi:hypothetical protein
LRCPTSVGCIKENQKTFQIGTRPKRRKLFHAKIGALRWKQSGPPSATITEHGCNIIVAIGYFMSYIHAMSDVLFALPFVVALAFAALTIRQEMR